MTFPILTVVHVLKIGLNERSGKQFSDKAKPTSLGCAQAISIATSGPILYKRQNNMQKSTTDTDQPLIA